MLKILVVDDHPLFRLGLRHALAAEFRQASFGEAGSAGEALDALSADSWNLVIMDLSMPGRNGLDLLGEIKTLYPALPVLMLTMYAEAYYAKAALKKGANGYVTKASIRDDLVQAVRTILSGRTYIGAATAQLLIADLRSAEKLPHELLSARELQVMLCLAKGKTVTETAKDLALSVKTVSTFRKRVLLKMKMKTNSELARYAIRHSLIYEYPILATLSRAE